MQESKNKAAHFNASAMTTGFIGGVFWSLIAWLAYYFHFTTYSAADFLLRSWVWMDWTSSWVGEIIGILLTGVLSIGVALVYFILLKKQSGVLPAMLFGAALWVIVYFIFTPVIYGVSSALHLDRNANITSMCLYVLYAVFVGYSISYEYEQSKAYANNSN